MSNIQQIDLPEVGIPVIPVDALDSEEAYVVFLAIDASGSMDSYVMIMQQALGSFKDAILNSKDAREFLICRCDFHDRFNNSQMTGYAKLEDMETLYQTYGMTPLFDAIVNGKETFMKYRQLLLDGGERVRGAFVVFSDGLNNNSFASESQARKAIEDLKQSEIVTAFIGFGDEAQNIGANLGFKNVMESNADGHVLRGIFSVLSKSLSQNSKRVNGGTVLDGFQI